MPLVPRSNPTLSNIQWQRPCVVALGCSSLNNCGIKMLRGAAVFTAHVPSPHKWAGARRSRPAGSGSYLFSKTPFYVHTQKCAQIRPLSAIKSPFHLLFRQILRFRSGYISLNKLSPSHLQSLGAQLRYLGDGQTSGHEQGF